jgi:hypothetical protein
MARYPLVVKVTDDRPGWRLGTTRVLPQAFTVSVFQPGWLAEGVWIDFQGMASTDPAIRALDPGDPFAHPWLELDIDCDADRPPRCVGMRAPGGIGTRELRFPLAGIVATAAASVASRDGTFLDGPTGAEYDDMRAEVGFAQKRDRTRSAVTTERLAEIAEVARQHPNAPTAAVQRRFHYARGYARRLIKRAEAEGLF